MSEEPKVKRKYFRENVGMVFRIDLQEDEAYAYGQVATETKYIFFNNMDKKDQWTPIEEIIQKPLAFYATVDRYVLKEGLWEILGVWPVKPENQVFPDPYFYDPFLNTYKIYKTGVGPVFCEPEEIKGREPLTSWGHGGIQQRLRDHFAKRPNYDRVYDRTKHLSEGFPNNSEFPTRKEFYEHFGYDFHWLDDEEEQPIKKQRNAISPKNPKREEYMEAARKMLADDKKKYDDYLANKKIQT